MNEDEVRLQMDDDFPINLVFDDDPLGFSIGGDVIPLLETDYNHLYNKPSINNVTLVGNKNMSDLFPDGLIIDGGSAEGVES